jgi:pyruvate kinase
MNNWGNRTRIVATIGPASGAISQLKRMVNIGMNVSRLNFSHGTHAEHLMFIKHIRLVEKSTGKKIAILADLQGPKIRIGSLIEAIKVKEGEVVTFESGSDKVHDEAIPISYKGLAKFISKGERIFVDDGILEFEVISKKGSRIKAKVVHGGVIGSHKGINIPDTNIGGDPFTDKDLADLDFVIKNGVDWIALSFVDEPSFVKKIDGMVTRLASKYGVVKPKILIKMERKLAVDNFLDFLPYIDGVMVARGDLGVELPFEQLPMLQKELIEICRLHGKPVIVATHMLESMRINPRATRAEVSDVANAVIDHADAVMLSAETATGEHPFAAVMTMAKVIGETEKSMHDDLMPIHNFSEERVMHLAGYLQSMSLANVIDGIVIREDSSLFERIGIYRPKVPIFAVCENETVARQVLLRSGVYPIVLKTGKASFVHQAEMQVKKMFFKGKKCRLAFVEDGGADELRVVIR